MLKNWKSLFVKSDEEESNENSSFESLSFPLNAASSNTAPPSAAPAANYSPKDPALLDVLEVYESGLDSINMPGYDFYEFYKAIESTGHNSEQAYKMAYLMAKTLDKTISPGKFLQDAEFYISKINEVYNDYVRQGQQKLNAIQEKKQQEKGKLNSEIESSTKRIAQIRNELTQLEAEINTKRSQLARIDENNLPQEKSIQDKLYANDYAHKVSIDKLNIVKQCIQQYIKE